MYNSSVVEHRIWWRSSSRGSVARLISSPRGVRGCQSTVYVQRAVPSLRRPRQFKTLVGRRLKILGLDTERQEVIQAIQFIDHNALMRRTVRVKTLVSHSF